MVARGRSGNSRPRRKYVPKESPGGVEKMQELENQFQSEYGSASRAIDYARGRAEQAEADRNMGASEAADIIRARGGDDSGLFPYTPTPSINPPRPRTIAGGYSKDTNTLRVKFRNGSVYEYYDVPPNVWRNFQRVKSPGRHINRVLNNYAYARRNDLEG